MSDQDTSQTVALVDFAGKTRRFQLRIGEAEQLESRCNAGIGAIMLRVGSGNFYTHDIWDTIELGLIGGGENNLTAERIVKALKKQNNPLYWYAHIAAATLKAFLMGFDSVEGQEGNDDAAGQDEPLSPET